MPSLSPALGNGRFSLETAARRVWLDSKEVGRGHDFASPISAQDVAARARVFARRTMAAYDDIDAFEKSTSRGVWPKLSKAEIIHGLRRRVLEPCRVEQGPAPFCGPASIAYELARRNPQRYVRSVRDLFERGTFIDATRKRISASRKLRTFPPFGEITVNSSGDKIFYDVPQVDWIFLATLREAANVILNVTGGFEGLNALKGATTAWEMVEWSKRILGSSRAKIHRAKPMGEFGIEPGLLDGGSSDVATWVANIFRSPERDVGPEPAFRDGVRTLAAGGSAMLMINAQLLKKLAPPFTLWPNVSTHWVSLVTGHSDLRRFDDGPPMAWRREVALSRRSTSASNFTWVRPTSTITNVGSIKLSTFTWGSIEFRTITKATLRRHLFAVVIAP